MGKWENIKEGSLEHSLQLIIWYDGWEEWLRGIQEDMKILNEDKKVSEYKSYRPEIELNEWHTEKHTIWMLLVGMFGEWGTSIRSGWIEKYKFNDCIEFIEEMILEREEKDYEKENY